ncbi:MAG: DNA topoisomerase (ATP-hydrolyzing) subunit B [Sphaerochaetaceae bacterium]|nr:DNA topoisomerase (ATP-hydrolyzing) subunit B [Spirochaetales bacterium]MDY3768446.1 DNA topoisomerase (ATP-hydrolyzing) subunit B [Sphaerochaetaceae bacterium]MDY5968051.1 DNA topoisomerase (ATP-hydrolyzing) subunit B [Sphaerochaetaceae bacterium]
MSEHNADMPEERQNHAMGSGNYGSDSIRVLKGLEGVRKRPGMYIGSQGIDGLHHMVYEVVDNSIDEAMAGYCDNIKIILEKNRYVTVEDNGRGIPVGKHPSENKNSLEVALTVLHAGGKFESGAYSVSGGLHGVGVSVVNALSEHLEAIVYRDGGVFKQEYSKGIPLTEVQRIGDSDRTGTIIRFTPDFSKGMMEDNDFDYRTLSDRMRELAFLNKGIRITITDEREDEKKEETFCYEGGINSFITLLNENKKVINEQPIYLSGKIDNGEKRAADVEIAIQYNDRYDEILFGFVNNINTREGGTHVSGFRAGLTRAINEQLRKNTKISKKFEQSLEGSDLREGLVAIVSVKMADPQFEGQTKMKLGNQYIMHGIASLLYEKLNDYLDEHPDVSSAILEKAVLAAKARIAARDARQRIRKDSEGMGLPGKLADCSEKDPALCELFIVEGDSAGGSAKQGRNRKTQAILSLWGKMLNVEKSRDEKVMGNDKLQPIIASIGAGLGATFDIEKARYHKIIIMADADVDGSHIRTLLLTFFFRYMKPLIENGYVYFAMPPLYKVSVGKGEKNSFEKYVYDDEEYNKFISSDEVKGRKYTVARFKGLGEMDPAELWETTMDPDKRFITQVHLGDFTTADGVFTKLMGEEVEPRRVFIEENALNVTNLDV